MKGVNKYLYMNVIQGYYGHTYGWEDVDQSEDEELAKVNFRLYKENEPKYPHRLIKRRVPNPAYTRLDT